MTKIDYCTAPVYRYIIKAGQAFHSGTGPGCRVGKRGNEMNAVDTESSLRQRALEGVKGAARDLLERVYTWLGRWENQRFSHLPSGVEWEDLPLPEELYRKVQIAFSKLPDKYSDVLRLFYLEDWKCADIATALNLSLPQVEALLLHGRSLLKASLQWPGKL